MTLLSTSTAVVLGALALLHVLWGARIWWPIRNEKALARAVTGFPKVSTMPPTVACLPVAIALLLAAWLAIALNGEGPAAQSQILTVLGVMAATVFLLRGLFGYLPFWARLTSEQPFRALDVVLYSPLCLALGSSFLVLA